jgi:hypothetical protein
MPFNKIKGAFPMQHPVAQVKRSVCLGLAMAGLAVMTGCAVVPAANIKPGFSNVGQVEQAMGKPNMTWRNSQGKVIQAAYSQQPASFTTFMVYFNDQGVVTGVDQVMNNKNFAKIKNGMDGQQVHKILGPERSVDHFSALHQIDWNYGYCSDNDGREVFSVSFDDKTLKVNGSVVTPDPLFSLGDNEEARCVPYIMGETYAR